MDVCCTSVARWLDPANQLQRVAMAILVTMRTGACNGVTHRCMLRISTDGSRNAMSAADDGRGPGEWGMVIEGTDQRMNSFP
jgi:hypothetical protein